MNTYLALIRGINVGGNKIIKMEELKKAFEKAKFTEVRTYIQSGNVFFVSPETKHDILEKQIQKLILENWGYEVEVMVRTMEEIEEIAKYTPFPKAKLGDNKILSMYVLFLKTKPDAKTKELIESFCTAEEKFHIRNSEIYALIKKNIPNNGVFAKNLLEKKVKIAMTNRNWLTLGKMVEWNARN